MPKFIDYHAQLPKMDPQAVEQMTAMIKSGQPGPGGVKALNIFIGTGGQGYCLSEAPTADAVVQAHAAQGIKMDAGDVVEVMSLV